MPFTYTPEARQASIYGLYDRSGALRYIGKAVDPEKRLKGHMREHRRRTPLYDWLQKHGRPELRILEARCDDWREAERRLIAKARARGERLLNLADGGDEPLCSTSTRRANAQVLNNALRDNPFRLRIRDMKRSIGQALRQGHVRNVTRAKLRYVAERRPDLFGAWRDLPDRIET